MAVMAWATGAIASGAVSVARQLDTRNSYGVLNLAGAGAQASGDWISVLATSSRRPCVSRKDLANRSVRETGGTSLTKWRAIFAARWRAVWGLAARSASTP